MPFLYHICSTPRQDTLSTKTIDQTDVYPKLKEVPAHHILLSAEDQVCRRYLNLLVDGTNFAKSMNDNPVLASLLT